MTIKSERVAELLQVHLSQLLLTDVRDPRLQAITITEIKLDREIEHAEIYVNALGDESREREVMQALYRAQGFLRSELAHRLRLRRMPQLHFKWDHLLSQANTIENVLNSLKTKESQPDNPPADESNTQEG
jgi:ribosome-binding factor A